jgi:hypothetical protein
MQSQYCDRNCIEGEKAYLAVGVCERAQINYTVSIVFGKRNRTEEGQRTIALLHFDDLKPERVFVQAQRCPVRPSYVQTNTRRTVRRLHRLFCVGERKRGGRGVG